MPKDQVNIRPAAAADAEAVFRIHASVGGSIPWLDAEECREHLEWIAGLGNPTIVAELDGEVVGSMDVWWGQDVPELGRSLDVSMIDVRADRQRRGVGRAMIGHACKLAESNGCDCVSVRADPAAGGFYEKMGFTPRLTLRDLSIAPDAVTMPAGFSLDPVKLSSLAIPPGGWFRVGRILHPRQRWRDMLALEAEPPLWGDSGQRRPAVSAFLVAGPDSGEPAVAVYRLGHWANDASKAELCLWSGRSDRPELLACVAHASTLGVRELSAFCYGGQADTLAEAGAARTGTENVLYRPCW